MAISRTELAIRGAVVALTTVGLTGSWFAAWTFFQFDMLPTGGCGGGGAVALAFIAFLGLVAVAILGALSVLNIAGIVLLWFQYEVGAGLLIPSNLAAMVILGWVGPADPGHLAWVIAIICAAVMPVIALGLLVWSLVRSIKTVSTRLIAMAGGALAIAPFAVFLAYGLAADVARAETMPSAVPAAATAQCGSAS